MPACPTPEPPPPSSPISPPLRPLARPPALVPRRLAKPPPPLRFPSAGLIVVVTQLLRCFVVFRPLGVLIVAIRRMLDDLLTFAVLFIVVTLSFSSGLAGLQRTHYAQQDFRGDMITGDKAAPGRWVTGGLRDKKFYGRPRPVTDHTEHSDHSPLAAWLLRAHCHYESAACH